MTRDGRTFIKVHDGMPDHPKIEVLSDAAFRLLVTTWCWCSRHLTDGRVPDRVWARRGDKKSRAELLASGLVEAGDGFVYMHDYLEHQRSAAEVAALKEKRQEAGRKGGKARAKSQAGGKQVLGAQNENRGNGTVNGAVDDTSTGATETAGVAPVDDSVDNPPTSGNAAVGLANGQASAKQVLEHVPEQMGSKAQAETETEVLPTEALKPSGGNAPSARPKKTNQGDVQRVVGAWIDGVTGLSGERPAASLISRMGKQVKALLGEGKDPDRLSEAARSCGAKGYDDLGRELLAQARAASAHVNGHRSPAGHHEITNGWDV